MVDAWSLAMHFPRMAAQSEISKSVPEELEINKSAWNTVAPKFAGSCALLHWSPFGEGRSLDLLGPLKGATAWRLDVEAATRSAECSSLAPDMSTVLIFQTAKSPWRLT